MRSRTCLEKACDFHPALRVAETWASDGVLGVCQCPRPRAAVRNSGHIWSIVSFCPFARSICRALVGFTRRGSCSKCSRLTHGSFWYSFKSVSRSFRRNSSSPLCSVLHIHPASHLARQRPNKVGKDLFAPVACQSVARKYTVMRTRPNAPLQAQNSVTSTPTLVEQDHICAVPWISKVNGTLS